jgi:hypothetical protein
VRAMCKIVFLIAFVSLSLPLFAEEIKNPEKHPDAQVVKQTLEELFKICQDIDWKDPKVTELGPFYKADRYVVYRGPDRERRWKDFANYSDPEERKNVDGVCVRINETINRSGNYEFGKFIIEKESEGTWHVWEVFYTEGDKKKRVYFAFLKIGDRYGIGDID